MMFAEKSMSMNKYSASSDVKWNDDVVCCSFGKTLFTAGYLKQNFNRLTRTSLAALTGKSSKLAEGSRAPDALLCDLKGVPVRLMELFASVPAGRPLILNFGTTSTCVLP
jgi:hypothetical protein